MTGKQIGIMVYRGAIVREYLNNHYVSEENLNTLKKIILRGYIALTEFLIVLYKAKNNPKFIITTEKYKKVQKIRIEQKNKKMEKKRIV